MDEQREREWRLALIPLKVTWQATENELDHLRRLIVQSTEQRSTGTGRIESNDSTRPSAIINSFLFHGDVKQASNKALLNELEIQSIINVSECRLDE